jgi:hypothetical protein
MSNKTTPSRSSKGGEDKQSIRGQVWGSAGISRAVPTSVRRTSFTLLINPQPASTCFSATLPQTEYHLTIASYQPTYRQGIIMVQTRNAEKSAKDEASEEQIENPIENTSDTPDTSSENKTESKADDGASKARDRMERFKALQARAVSGL